MPGLHMQAAGCETRAPFVVGAFIFVQKLWAVGEGLAVSEIKVLSQPAPQRLS